MGAARIPGRGAGAVTEAPTTRQPSGCVSAFVWTGFAVFLLGALFHAHPFAGLAASVAVVPSVLAWRRPSGWRWLAVPLLAAAGATIGLWWDETLGRPPGTSVADNLRWIGDRNAAWILYAAIGVGAYALVLLRLVPSKPLRGFAIAALVPAMLVMTGMMDYAQGGVREPLGRDARRSRYVLRNLERHQEAYRSEHGAYAVSMSELPVDSIVPPYLEGFVIELEEADSAGFSARAYHPRMPEPCTIRVRAGTREGWNPTCPDPVTYRELLRWGL